jgi:hypothetical protein
MQVQPTTAYNPSLEANRKLAEKIIAEHGNDNYVKKICSNENFIKDPIAHLVNEMIQRWVGRCRMDDGARATVVGEIPGFIETVSSPEYLKAYAVTFFKNEPNADKIMAVFEKSITSNNFKADLAEAKSCFEAAQKNSRGGYYHAENELRIALTVFYQSKQLQAYRCPDDASLE